MPPQGNGNGNGNAPIANQQALISPDRNMDNFQDDSKLKYSSRPNKIRKQGQKLSIRT